ncbi:hypothetical protein BDV98DRAFT_510326 [Pterulicium gracile]|uniref:Transcription initiation factor TFIID subunit 1 histone acetyltransferase domain-containing protein n=1 Tax=Pterulicium gracile TaxID=1884261 RepID=A0A5C3QCI6_9AGAR|nr:hypothetical protein BDV98DRAFT_510326 [Pterula gracilis]
MASEEDNVISTLTGFSLDSVLSDFSLPAGTSTALSNQLGISGIPSLTAAQIYSDNWADGAVGTGEGDDWEDQVDLDMKEEGGYDADGDVKMEENDDMSQLRVKKKRIREVRRLVERSKTVHERFPAYERNKVLDFTDLFKGFTPNKSRLSKRPFYVEAVYPRKRDNPRNFLDTVVGDAQRQVENKRAEEFISTGNIERDLRRALAERQQTDVPIDLTLHDRSFDLVLLSNWEDQILFDTHSDNLPSSAPSNIISAVPESNNLTTPVNKALETGAWTQSIMWNPKAPFRDFTQIEFNHEDDVSWKWNVAEVVRPRKRFRTDASIPKDRFNVSNDHMYEVAKDGRARVRQTFGQISVEHAYPAQKLQLPFYKTRLSKQEARSFHRPALQFPLNIELRFSKVRSAKKKKDKAGRKLGKGGNAGEALRRTTDLTLKDTSNFVLWEYSEEHPPIIPNFGMACSLVNYYRKKDEKDDHIPKYDLGLPFVLEPQDESPFMKFGYVYPGQTVPVMYNNLVRAPLFRHKAKPTDFLVVRSTIKNDTKYYIREIKNMFVLGQTFPVTEVPGPHSRKITNTIKFRLQIIAFKLLRKSAGQRLKISRLMKYFPDQNELQMRQRLKEFMEYHRRGDHQGFWRLKAGWTIPTDADMLKMIGPEQVVLCESMQVGQRHLQDAGFSQPDSADGDEQNLSVEQQLAPWITTKNFSYATQAKAMLRLHGEGDPTGRGEAFSFIRISMKDIFVKAGEDYETKMAEVEARPKSAHRYNVAEQQQIYKSEIERIWKAQFDSLTKKEEPKLTAEDERADAQARAALESRARKADPTYDLIMGGAGSPPAFNSIMPPPGGAGPMSPAQSRASSVDRFNSVGPDGSGKRVLRIKRVIDGQVKYEIVRDEAVMRAYVRARQLKEEENTMTNSLAPTGDADKDKRAKKRLEEEIARMKKNQERRLHRKNAKIVKEGGTPMQLDRPLKPDTTRKCGHCGQMGHMKTNRKCPRWAEFNSGNPPLPPTPSSAGPAGSPVPSGMPPVIAASGSSGYGFPAVSSPLATSPPIGGEDAGGASSSGPKIKLSLKRG